MIHIYDQMMSIHCIPLNKTWTSGSLCQQQFDLGLFIDIAYQQHLSDSLPV